ncbi:MAG: hypothetical protein AAF467_16755 [Actinomycetota bacterium]
MFPSRRSPFGALLLVGLGFFLATVVAGSAVSAVAGVLGFLFNVLIFFLVIKLLFFGFAMFGWGRRGRRGRGPWGRHRGWHHGERWSPERGRGRRGEWYGADDHERGRPGSPPWSAPRDRDDGAEWRYKGRPFRPTPPRPASSNDPEWEQHLEDARREVDDIDAPYNKLEDDLGERR